MKLRKIDNGDSDKCRAPKSDLPVLDFVPVKALRINEAYQRQIEKRGWSNIKTIAENFNWGRFSPLLVARLDGGLYAIIDGQHRAHAAALCGIKHVPALISDLDEQQQAAAFSWVNGNVTYLTPNQIFRAALAAMEPWAIQCDAVVARAGCTLMAVNKSSKEKQPGEVFCIGTVRRFVEGGSSQYLVAALAGLKQSTRFHRPVWYGRKGLMALVSAAQTCGVTRPEIIAEFLSVKHLDRIAISIERLQLQPDYIGQTFSSLFADSVTVLLKDWLRSKDQVAP